MITQLTDQMLETINQEPHLRRYLEGLSQEHGHTPRSWLYDGDGDNPFMEPDQVLHAWLDTLSTLEKSDDQLLRNVYQFDTSQIEKWGPQGGHAPIKELMPIIEEGYSMGNDASRTPAFGSSEWAEAKANIAKKYRAAGAVSLRPASYESVIEDMQVRDTLDSKSGWPQNMPRKDESVRAKAIADAESGKWREYPAIALFRNYNAKTRLVWMYPMATNLVEGSFFQPLQSVLMNSRLAESFFSPWKGFEQVRSVVTNAYRRGFVVSASDFSSTDAHFQKSATAEVADVIEQCFQFKYRAELRESLMHMHEIPLVIGLDTMEVGDHGVSSGSNWTNFVETVFDDILAEYYHILDSQVKGLYGIGDDMSWISMTNWGDSFKKQLEEIGASVGQQIKAEKTTSERDRVKTLQRLFQRGYFQENGTLLRGVYPTVRALKSCVYPERFHKPEEWDADMFCTRQFMILENCVDHPLFNEFVAFVCKGNRHLVPFAKQSASQLDAIQVRAKHVHGLTSTYNQEKRDQSLSSFASIRVAASL